MGKKGFSLIELLAVLAIVAIVGVITTPVILNVVNDSKKSAYLESVRGLVRSVNLDEFKSENGRTYEIKNNKISPFVNIHSMVDGSGTIIVDEQKNISVKVGNSKWCVLKSFSDTSLYIEDNPCDKVDVVENSDTSGAYVPPLDATMVPIMWKNNTWVKADERNPKGTNQWYDYNNSKWANIAVVKTKKISYYDNLEVGKGIDENDIVGYLVWVPKFEYQIPSGNGARQIHVNFKQMNEPVTNGYKTHPAFNWGSRNLRGFWIGKFETTGTLENLSILPKENILKGSGTGVKKVYEAITKFNEIKNKDKYKENFVEIHLLKNTEWGATTYLSQSKYGRCQNNSCPDVAKSSNVNVTGYGPSNKTYETTIGMTASTTNNIYGVYDMVGGTWEYVMGAMDITKTFGSEIIPIEQYDNYKDILNGIPGDATIETANWYGSKASYPIAGNYKHFFIRGGDSNTADAGLFFYDADSGSGGFRNGYRLAIAPEEIVY